MIDSFDTVLFKRNAAMNVFLLFWLWIGILVVNCEPKTTRVLNFKMSNLKSSEIREPCTHSVQDPLGHKTENQILSPLCVPELSRLQTRNSVCEELQER